MPACSSCFGSARLRPRLARLSPGANLGPARQVGAPLRLQTSFSSGLARAEDKQKAFRKLSSCIVVRYVDCGARSVAPFPNGVLWHPRPHFCFHSVMYMCLGCTLKDTRNIILTIRAHTTGFWHASVQTGSQITDRRGISEGWRGRITDHTFGRYEKYAVEVTLFFKPFFLFSSKLLQSISRSHSVCVSRYLH